MLRVIIQDSVYDHEFVIVFLTDYDHVNSMSSGERRVQSPMG